MSDIHPLPLMGHDMPEVIAPRALARAHVYKGQYGWYWEHQCAPGWWKNSGFPYIHSQSAYDAAVKHLKECCR